MFPFVRWVSHIAKMRIKVMFSLYVRYKIFRSCIISPFPLFFPSNNASFLMIYTGDVQVRKIISCALNSPFPLSFCVGKVSFKCRDCNFDSYFAVCYFPDSRIFQIFPLFILFFDSNGLLPLSTLSSFLFLVFILLLKCHLFL